jgi:hypothetical protein
MEDRRRRVYRNYVVATARYRWNVALAFIYIAAVLGCFLSGHTTAGGIILGCAVVIWMRPVALLVLLVSRRN